MLLFVRPDTRIGVNIGTRPEPVKFFLLVRLQGLPEQGLVVPRVPAERSFADEADIRLEADSSVRVRVDMPLKVQALEGGIGKMKAVELRAGTSKPIPDENLRLIDWQNVYLELLE